MSIEFFILLSILYHISSIPIKLKPPERFLVQGAIKLFDASLTSAHVMALAAVRGLEGFFAVVAGSATLARVHVVHDHLVGALLHGEDLRVAIRADELLYVFVVAEDDLADSSAFIRKVYKGHGVALVAGLCFKGLLAVVACAATLALVHHVHSHL